MNISKTLVSSVVGISILCLAFLLPVLGQDPKTADTKPRVLVMDATKYFDTLNTVDCLDWSWATDEQKLMSGKNGWGKWRPQNGDEGEVIFVTTHCTSKAKLDIVKIGSYYVPISEDALKFLKDPSGTPPKVGDYAIIHDPLLAYPTINENVCLDWSWATAEQKNRSGKSGWGEFSPNEKTVGEVVFIATHCVSKEKVYILKVGQNYVPIDALGLNVVPNTSKPQSPTGLRGVITNSGQVYDTLNQTNCLDFSWATPAQKYMSGSNGWVKWRPHNGDSGEVVSVATHCDGKTKMYVLKMSGYFVPVAETGLKVGPFDGKPATVKTVDEYIALGEECAGKKDFACAIANFTTAIQISPEIWNVYFDRGSAYTATGKKAEATADYTRAIDLFSTPFPAKADLLPWWQRRAYLYVARNEPGDPERAIADCSRAIELNPWFTFAYEVRAAAYRQLGRVHEAELDEQKVKELQSK